MKVVLFDLFGVICSPPISPTIDRYVQDQEQHQRLISRLSELDIGDASEKDILSDIAKTAGVPYAEVVQTSASYMNINYEMVKLIDSLSSDYKVALLTNAGVKNVREGIAAILHIFNYVYISAELGMIKPNPDIFEYALSDMSVDAEDVLFIDDRQENVSAAKKLGMSGLVFTDAASLKSYLDKLN